MIVMTEQEFNRNIEGVRKQLVHFAEGFAVSGAATAEDMVQEAVMRVWGLNCNGEYFRSMEAVLFTVLRNICLDYIKLKKNNNRSLDKMPGFSPDNCSYASPHQALETKEKIEMLKTFLRCLPADQQVVLRLRDVMGYELDEIAVILDTTQGNIRTMLSRVRGKLRCYLINCK